MSVASGSGRIRAERQAASRLPLLNDFRAEDWRKKLAAEFGIKLPRAATKIDLYKAWRAARASTHTTGK
jgi:hypothetical protein